VPTKTYSLLGVARGTSPQVTTQTLEAPELTVNAVPDLTRRALIVTLGTFALVSILASIIQSPLEEPANALVTPNPAKAPCTSCGCRRSSRSPPCGSGPSRSTARFWRVILPGLLVTVLTFWPWIDKSAAVAAGVWFAPARRRQNLVFLLVMLGILILTIVGTYLRGPYWNFYWPWEAWPEIPARI